MNKVAPHTDSQQAAGRSARRNPRFLLLLYGLGTFLLAALWFGAWFQLRSEARNIDDDGEEQAQLLARSFGGFVARQLQRVDHTGQLFQALHQSRNGNLKLDGFWLADDVLNQSMGNEMQPAFALYDANGQLLQQFPPQTASPSLSGSALLAELARRPHLASKVQTVRLDKNRWGILFSRRLQDAQGHFSGVLQIQLDPLDLLDAFEDAELETEASIMLRDMDSGLILTRHAHRMQLEADWQLQEQPGGHLQISRSGGEHNTLITQQYFKLEALPGYNVQAIAGLPRSFGEARYAHYVRMYCGYAALVSLLIISGIALLTWQTRRLHASEQAAHAAERLLRQAAEGSLDAFYLLHAQRNAQGEIQDFIVQEVNRRGARLLGMPVRAIRGQALLRMLPIFKSAGYFDVYVRVANSGSAEQDEYQIDIPQIRARWLQHQIVAIEGGVAITVRDISARKEAELELRNSRNFLRSLVDNLPVLVSVSQVVGHAGNYRHGPVLVWNRYAENISGILAEQVLGQTLYAVMPPGLGRRFLQRHEELLANPALNQIASEDVLPRQDGSESHLRLLAVTIRTEQGVPEYILTIGEDITRRRMQEQQLRESQAELAAVNDASPLGLVRADADGMCTYVNKTFEAISGLARDAALGDGWMAAIYQEDRPQILQAFQWLSETRLSYQGVFRFAHADGRLVWASVKIAAIVLDGKITGYVGSVDDITQRRAAEIAITESENLLRTIINAMPTMLAYVDAQQRYRFWNLAYAREIGIDMQDCEGKAVRDVVGEKRYAIILPYVQKALSGVTVQYDDDVSHEGEFRMLECTLIPQFGSDGKTVLGFHVMRHDITAKKLEERRLLQLAQLDVLTGISNRAGFMQKLRDAMARCRQHPSLMALMYMDIDYFKAVNDTHGHRAGDLLLAAFAERLRHTLRASDTIARLGGDEFTVLMEQVMRAEDAQMIAEKIVLSMRQPFECEGLSLQISTSLGLAWFYGGEMSADALLNQADMMLYQAKRNGRNSWRMAHVPQVGSDIGHS